uniref:Reverse transcriptase domain-containing protein n=1 Tax=Hordeum vulgare subsp. vulgare TaxID=112509 RepID=A0A8I6XM60_HORVV
MLESRGFGSKWILWIQNLLFQGTFSVCINDTTGPYFVGGKGLKQGDPISPILFNLVADVFTKMLAKAARQGLISGVLSNVIPGGLLVFNMQTILSSFWRILMKKQKTLNGSCHVLKAFLV